MQPVRSILLVEDNDDDAELTLMAFSETALPSRIVRVASGEEGLEYVFAEGRHSGRSAADMPAVVLLDLRLPGIGGIQVLEAIRGDARTKHLPVVVLTSSDEDSDRLAAYDRHVNSYIQKPVDYDRFVVATRQLGVYWTELNRPAPDPRATRSISAGS